MSWKPVSEPPKESKRILVYCPTWQERIFTGRFTLFRAGDGQFDIDGQTGFGDDVKFWMELPPAPDNESLI